MLDFDKVDFYPLVREEQSVEQDLILRPGPWQRLKANRLALFGTFMIGVIVLLAVFGPLFTHYGYAEQNLMIVNQGPSAKHWFGTDNLGRDLFVRVLYGARISLSIGLISALINLIIGVLYGGIAGYFGGKIDRIMMSIVDVLYGIPLLIYVILLMVLLKPGLLNIFIALGIAFWLTMARIVRGQILRLKEEEFVLAAKSMGASHWRILWKHIFPNCLAPIIITLMISIPEAIFTEAFLSFIGLGVSAPMASWGVLASEGVTSLAVYPYQLFFPACAISVTMLSFTFIGDGLRDAFDPKKGGR